jgi:hypothetical protein
MDSAQTSNLGPAEQVSLQDNATPSHLIKPQFVVDSVAKVAEPNGGTGDDWYRYELAGGLTRITGYHRGSPEEVMAYAQNCAQDFNLRNATGKSSRAFASSKTR